MNDEVWADISAAASGMQVEETSNDRTRDEDIKSSSTESELIIDATSLQDDIKNRADQLLKSMLLEGVDMENAGIKKESVVTVDLWDFAGQHLYYASHPVFLSPRALYILVHNLSKPLNAPAQPCVRQGTLDLILKNPNNETNLENLLSWLVTVHSIKSGERMLPYLRPPVFIVGTHADKPFEDTRTATSKIKQEISGKEYEKHVIRPFFNIDNTQGKQNQSLLQLIWNYIFGKNPQKSHQAGKLVSECKRLNV